MYSSNSGSSGDNEAMGRQYRFDSMNIELGESPDAVERGTGSSFLARLWKNLWSNTVGKNGTGERNAFERQSMVGNSVNFEPVPTDEASAERMDGITSKLHGRWCPEEEAGIFGRAFFGFVSGILNLGYMKNLEQEDLWDMCKSDEAFCVSRKFEDVLRKTRDDVHAPSGRVALAMWRMHRKRFILAGLVKLVHDILMFLGPFLLELLLKHVQAGGNGWVGLGYAVALSLAAVLQTLTVNYYFHEIFRICLHLKTSLIDCLYQKSLRISQAAKMELGSGAVVNLQSNDAAKLWKLPQYLHMLWSAPFQILTVLILLMRIIHPIPSMVGLGVCIALIPLSTIVAKIMAAIRRRQIVLTDARVKLSSEVVQGIKAIKLYAWEKPYQDRIKDLRTKELKEIRKSALIGTWNNMIWIGGPILISMGALLTYSLMGYPLTAAVAFPALSLFNLLRFPVMMLPQQLMNLINAKVALERIQNFMEADEMKQRNLQDVGEDSVAVHSASFSWGRNAPLLLKDIDLNVGRGQLLMVVGEVGSGKTSLLNAILGEMTSRKGTVEVQGTIGYTQQDPWIQNATLRDNILMGLPYEKSRYMEILDVCALLPDIEMLPAGDDTEIGEKGVNLSGGQRHRVALARACYSDADTYLLDDPLSAVDAHVGRHLFDKCISGLLGQKSRILVTHHLQWLPVADKVVVLSEGRIANMGTYKELVESGINFHKFELESSYHDENQQVNSVIASSDDTTGPQSIIGDHSNHPSGTSGKDNNDPTKITYESNSSALTDCSLENMPHAVEGDLEIIPESNGCSNSASPRNALHNDPDSLPLEDISLEDKRSDSDEFTLFSSQSVCVTAETGGAVTSATATKAPSSSAGQKRINTHAFATKGSSSGQLTKSEDRAIGQVDKRVYLRYFASWGPAFLVPIAVLSLALIERGLQAGQNWWLSVWSEATAAAQEVALNNSDDDFSPTYYMKVYFAIGLLSLFFQILKAITLVLGSISAARRLQESLLATVLHLPMSFFDSQPTGRLLNRFTKDTEAVDTLLQSSVSSFLNCSVSVAWSLIVVLAVSPGVALTILPLGFVYYSVQKRYIRTSRELKRLDSIALSPIFSHFSETLQGLATLRAFRAQPRFEDQNLALLNESNRCFWPAQCVNRWLSVRLELIGISIVFATALFVSTPIFGTTSAGLAGLALTSALNLTGLMNWMVRQTTELEVNMNSVERLVEYDTVEPEAPSIIMGHRPRPDWPSRGALDVRGLVVRYRPELDPVLRGITFKVNPGEKIGVVGRTGCGKSTLMLALYRIVEPSAGQVIIDGIDVSTIGLEDLRSKLALVPQDPVIFSGTIRSNLDPFGDISSNGASQYPDLSCEIKSSYRNDLVANGDSRIWSVLEKVGLKQTVASMEHGLDAKVAESGSNLSQGQRQLLCMARALLRSARILILDEATSSIDSATDAIIQSTLANSFAQCTVLTIAHRLHTIIGSDRILVLEAGLVKEYDSPQALLQKPNGVFKALVESISRDS